MDIFLNKVSKRFGQYYVLRDVDFHFKSHRVYGISGSNGSGKSTLLKILSGYLSYSKGDVKYSTDGKEISRDDIYKEVSMVAPDIEVIEDFDIREIFDFHTSFRQMPAANSLKEFRSILDYPIIKPGKYIKHYSSGMKKRVALALSILSKGEILLLDEPTSFLDSKGIEWFNNVLAAHLKEKTVIIASNDEADFKLCNEVISIDQLNLSV